MSLVLMSESYQSCVSLDCYPEIHRTDRRWTNGKILNGPAIGGPASFSGTATALVMASDNAGPVHWKIPVSDASIMVHKKQTGKSLFSMPIQNLQPPWGYPHRHHSIHLGGKSSSINSVSTVIFPCQARIDQTSAPKLAEREKKEKHMIANCPRNHSHPPWSLSQNPEKRPLPEGEGGIRAAGDRWHPQKTSFRVHFN